MASNSVFSELLRTCKLDGSNFTVWKQKIMYLLHEVPVQSLPLTRGPHGTWAHMSAAVTARAVTAWELRPYLLTAENIDYVIDVPEPEKPNNDASNEEKRSYLLEYEAWAKDNKRARIFILGSMTDSLAAEYEGE